MVDGVAAQSLDGYNRHISLAHDYIKHHIQDHNVDLTSTDVPSQT
jgi:hypothetical protein